MTDIKKMFRFKYALGLCVLLLLLFKINYFLGYFFYEILDIPYDSLFANIAQIILHAVIFIFVIWVGLKDQRKTLAKVCYFRKVSGGVWGAAILCSVGFVLFNFYIDFLFDSFKYGWYTDYEITDGNFIFNLINTAIIPAVAEEILFKGLVFTILKKHYSTITSVIMASLMFAGCHLNFIHLIPHFLFSLFTFWLYMRCGSLILPMFLHFINNLFTFVLISDPFANLGTFYAALVLLIIGSYLLYRLSKPEYH
ncbi:MAG: CPBP family intramembrane metalloprotease [Treponema sp.]|jgi:membrane protease YdiL (CAAX protease family)|nr:CPBP family intramembrane metalloprotease [Treponema sp.]